MSPNDVDDRSNSPDRFKDLPEVRLKEFRGRHGIVIGIQTSYRSISLIEFRHGQNNLSGLAYLEH